MITKCPVAIKNGPNDYVEYAVNTGDRAKDMGEKVCYHDVMRSLDKSELLIRPHNSQGVRASKDLYLAWMRLCQEHGLIPDKVEVYVEKDKNYLKIPGGIYDKHWIYATLCCYRFADAFARMVWLVVENVDRCKGDFTFWQALHYAMAAEYSYGSGHSFSYISASGYTPYDGGNAKDDLGSSIAIPLFFAKSVSARKKIDGYTNTAISKVASKLGGSETKDVKLEGYSRPVQKPFPVLRIDRMGDLLTPRWTPMYQLKNPTSKQLRELYEQVKSDGQDGAKIADHAA
jgi:hypothetical protein